MYSESDIEAAVASGAITPQAAAALRDSVAESRATPLVDEESFRLITGFNDIFVSVAAILVLVAVGWIGDAIGALIIPGPSYGWLARPPELLQLMRSMSARALVGGTAVAAASWLLAEYFTRRRRMTLPSILLLACFVVSVGIGVSAVTRLVANGSNPHTSAIASMLGGLGSATAAYCHWRRFHVPITIAALTGGLVVALLGLITAVLPQSTQVWLVLLLLSGLAVFALAMWWDMSDRARQTRRSDVAFWLHLAAAPMIAHPVFNLLGVLGDRVTLGIALVVLVLYLAFGFVALAIDRRALLVSSLLYVLVALADLFKQAGAVSLNIALTALIIGSALLLLSAFWQSARRLVVRTLPERLQARLPLLERPVQVSPRPA